MELWYNRIMIKIKGYKAVFVDFDLTLVDSRRIEDRALLQALERLGVKTDDIIIPPSNSFTFRVNEIKKHYGIEQDFAEIERQWIEAAFPMYAELDMVPGAAEFLRAAKNAGMSVNIVTLNERRFVDAAVKKAGVLVDNIFSKRDKNLHKWDGKLFLDAMHSLGFEPKDCVIIEDFTRYLDVLHGLGCLLIEVYGAKGISEPGEADHSVKDFTQIIIE